MSSASFSRELQNKSCRSGSKKKGRGHGLASSGSGQVLSLYAANRTEGKFLKGFKAEAFVSKQVPAESTESCLGKMKTGEAKYMLRNPEISTLVCKIPVFSLRHFQEPVLAPDLF